MVRRQPGPPVLRNFARWLTAADVFVLGAVPL